MTCAHPKNRRVLYQYWERRTPVVEKCPCSCGSEQNGIACTVEYTWVESGYTKGYLEEDGSVSWDDPAIEEREQEDVEQEQHCSCFPASAQPTDWLIESGQAEVSLTSTSEGCDACGDEWEPSDTKRSSTTGEGDDE